MLSDTLLKLFHPVMIIGFTQRRLTVSESDAPLGADTFPITLDVRSLRMSEREYGLLFRVLEFGNATVEASNVQFRENYDALFGTRFSAQDPIVDSRLLAVGNLQVTLITQIRNDVRPEEPLKCYEIVILSSDLIPDHITFSCNDDYNNPVNYFCRSTICIIDDDG